MRRLRLGTALALLTASGLSTVLCAEDAAEVQQLREQVEQLDQKLKGLERKRELEQESAAEKAKTTTTVSLGPGGFQVRSADSNFVFRVRGYVQGDARFYLADSEDAQADNTFLIRRARPIFEGSVYQKFDYRLMLDFGSGVTSRHGQQRVPVNGVHRMCARRLVSRG